MGYEERNMSDKMKYVRFSVVDVAKMFEIFGTPHEERIRVLVPEVKP